MDSIVGTHKGGNFLWSLVLSLLDYHRRSDLVVNYLFFPCQNDSIEFSCCVDSNKQEKLLEGVIGKVLKKETTTNKRNNIGLIVEELDFHLLLIIKIGESRGASTPV